MPLPNGLQVDRDRHGSTDVLRARGEIDLGTVDVFHEALDQVMVERPTKLVVDLTGVEFLGSCGISALATTRRRCVEQAVELRVVATNPPVLRILAVTGMDSLLAIFNSVDAATDRG
ncbi:STAS domain-containing protein [Actinokineospora sp. HUAS TT18]|uniref:STAS domain-containing protein n=1 Tax=Actinokineospora sp. HUAS TT18 TaxID=3447451 RepID=UPI003F523190